MKTIINIILALWITNSSFSQGDTLLSTQYNRYIVNINSQNIDSIYFQDSTVRYRTLFSSTLDYSEQYGYEQKCFREFVLGTYFDLHCPRHLIWESQLVVINTTDTLISPVGALLRYNGSLTVEGEDRLVNLRMTSFEQGEYVIFGSYDELQPGGDTSWGSISLYFLKREKE